MPDSFKSPTADTLRESRTGRSAAGADARLIYCIDGGGDTPPLLSGLADAIRLAANELGVTIKFDPLPDPSPDSEADDTSSTGPDPDPDPDSAPATARLRFSADELAPGSAPPYPESGIHSSASMNG